MANPVTKVLWDAENKIFVLHIVDPDNDVTTVRYLVPGEDDVVDTYKTSTGRGIGDTLERTNIDRMLSGIKTAPPELREAFVKQHPEHAASFPSGATVDTGAGGGTGVTTVGPTPPVEQPTVAAVDPVAELKAKLAAEQARRINPYERVDQFRIALARKDAEAIANLGEAFLRVEGKLAGDANKLASEIDDSWQLWLKSGPRAEWEKQLKEGKISQQVFDQHEREVFQGRMTNLAYMQQMHDKVGKEIGDLLPNTVLHELQVVKDNAMLQGVVDAHDLMNLSLPGPLANAFGGSFAHPSPEAMKAAIGFLDPSSKLFGYIQNKFSQDAANLIMKKVTSKILMGMDVQKLAREIKAGLREGMETPFSSIMNTVRTVSNNAYRNANHQTFKANSDIIKGWKWNAKLASNTCISCVRMHGTLHTIDEEMKSHNQCICTPIPVMASYADLGLQGFDDPYQHIYTKEELQAEKDKYGYNFDVDTELARRNNNTAHFQSGAYWLDSQTEEVQKSVLGKSYEQYSKLDINGKEEMFDKFSQIVDDPVWGKIIKPTPTKELEVVNGGHEWEHPLLGSGSQWKNKQALGATTPINIVPDMDDPEKLDMIASMVSNLEPHSKVYIANALNQGVTKAELDTNTIFKSDPVTSQHKYVTDAYGYKYSDERACYTNNEGNLIAGFFVKGNPSKGVKAEIFVHPFTVQADPTVIAHEYGHNMQLNTKIVEYDPNLKTEVPVQLQSSKVMWKAFKPLHDATLQGVKPETYDELRTMGLRPYSTKDIGEMCADTYKVKLYGTQEQKDNLAKYLGIKSLDDLFKLQGSY